MKLDGKSIHALLLAGMLALALGLVGCSDDDTTATTNSANARDQATLDAAADDAATASGISSFDALMESDAEEAGNAGSSATSSSGQESQPSYALSVNPDASAAISASNALKRAMAKFGRSAGILQMANSGANYATASTNVNATETCTSGGSVTVSGTVTVTTPDDSSASSGTITISILDLNIAFNGCDEGVYVTWGQLRMNTDDTLVYTIITDSSGNAQDIDLNTTFDEYVDGGLAILRNLDNAAWNFTLAWSLNGTLSGSVLNGNESVNVTETFTVVDNTTGDGWTCTSTIDEVVEIDNAAITCTPT